MKKLAFGALCIGLLTMAACGGGGDSVDARIVRTDGGDTASVACNITANTGCDPGEKCTWIRVSTGMAATEMLGQIGCAPEGAVAVGGACAWGASGEATGYDNCVADAICLASPAAEQATGTCSAICSLADLTLACPAAHSCGAYYKFGSNNSADMPAFGICDANCNPLTRTRDFDTAPECGSMTPATPNRGCYGTPSRTANPTDFSCASMSTVAATRGHGALIPEAEAFLNSCVSGAINIFYESAGSTNVICMAMCDPQVANNTLPANAKSGMSPYSCPQVPILTPTARATDAGEACMFFWAMEGANTPITPASNDFGLCRDFADRTWDNDNNPATPEVPWPDPAVDLVPWRTINADPNVAVQDATADLGWGMAPWEDALTAGPDLDLRRDLGVPVSSMRTVY